MKKTVSILLVLMMLFSVMSVGASALSMPELAPIASGPVEVLHYSPNEEHSSGAPAAAQVNRFSSSDPNAPYTFYSTLNALEKEIYNGILSGAKPQETHTIKLSSPFVFTAVPDENGMLQMPEDMANACVYGIFYALSALMDDHPEMFWIGTFVPDLQRTIQQNSDGTYTCTVTHIVVQFRVPKGYADWNAVKTAYDSMMQVVNSVQIEGTTRFEQVKFIHDWIAKRVVYDDEFVYDTSYYATSVFLAPYITVCEGYSEAFKMLCDRAGIPCIVVVGDAGGPHAWNYVKMEDGNWYAVDVTWDDGWTDEKGNDLILYDYFLRGANSTEGSFTDSNGSTFGKSHIPTGERYITEGTITLTYPSLAAEGYMRMLLCANSKAIVDKAAGAVYLPEGVTLEESFIAPEGYTLYVDDVNNSTELYVVKNGADEPTETYRIVRLVKGRLGDVNLDGKVNAVDARWALQAASGVRELTAEQAFAANVNGDTQITAVDARWILQAASGVRVL